MNHGDSNSRRDGEEPIAPEKLVAALREPPARRVFVPPTIDAAIIRTAEQHFAQPERAEHWLSRKWMLGATAACAGALVLYFAVVSVNPRFAKEDINRDGRVDILDAFQLARESQSPSASRDLNHDGIVNQLDAEFIVRLAVRLEKGDKS